MKEINRATLNREKRLRRLAGKLGFRLQIAHRSKYNIHEDHWYLIESDHNVLKYQGRLDEIEKNLKEKNAAKARESRSQGKAKAGRL